MTSRSSLRSALPLIVSVLVTILIAVPASPQTSTPAVVSSTGYINGTPLADHTLAPFGSTGAYTLVAFVSTHPSWNGLPVSIMGLNDDLDNTWNLLTGPTAWIGSVYTLTSAIYYVHGPATSGTHRITVQLSNPAPLVAHVFAISGSNVAGPPISSALTGPGQGTSADVISAPISVLADSLLLAWVKNETSATASALDGYNLDPASTSFLWAESKPSVPAGSHTGHFQYSDPIGWQTAVVGLEPASGPVAFNQAVTADRGTAASITLGAVSPGALPLTYSVQVAPSHGALVGTPPNLTYTPDSGYVGSDAFTFTASDGVATSNVATVKITVQPTGPRVVGSRGYINGTPLAAHPMAAFNSAGASTIVAFISAHTPWNGLPVAIEGLTDSTGNTWNVLSGPTIWVGGAFPLLSAIYYVNAPATSEAHTLTVHLSNPSPLVAHVFAASGSDTAAPPITSAITDPGVGTSADVTTASIGVPGETLLLAWTKNETSATATALGGYTLDAESTSFLWAESQTVLTAGSYAGQFRYSSPIGWQAAIVGLAATTSGNHAPVASNGAITTSSNTAVSGMLVATDADSNPLTFSIVTNGTKGTATVTNAATRAYTYTPNADSTGTDTFTFKANDGLLDSNVATITVTIQASTSVPTPVITAMPPNPTNQTTATFSFTDAQADVSFLCDLDGSGFSACTSSITYAGPLAEGSHTFAVKAQNVAGNQSAAASFTWVIDTTTPPLPVITSTPASLTNGTNATFSFTDTEASVTFLCQLDDGAFSTCTSPVTYAGPLAEGNHAFSVKVQDAAGNQSAAASFTWMIDTTAPPVPVITSTPANPTSETSATFTFTETETSAALLCQLDGGAFSVCTSPVTYDGLGRGGHTFAVKAQDAASNQSAAASFSWRIDIKAPSAPVITSTPLNPTNQTSASFTFSGTPKNIAFVCQLDDGAFSTCSSPKTYSGLNEGSHTFAVKTQDPAGNLSSPATFTWMVDTTPPPAPIITSAPANPTTQTTAAFSFTDDEANVSFLCSLDGGTFSACSSPVTYSGLSAGVHAFSVKSQDAADNPSAIASFSWMIGSAVPPPSLVVYPADPTNQTSATFSFTDAKADAAFLCQLDGAAFSPCSSPAVYPGPLAEGRHTFAVKAQDASGNQSATTIYGWTIDITAPPTPVILATPKNPTKQTRACFKFNDVEAGVKFYCQIDAGGAVQCSTNTCYSNLSAGSHTFSVKAQDLAGNESGSAKFTWSIIP